MKRLWPYLAALLPITTMTTPDDAAVAQPSEDTSDDAIPSKQEQPPESDAEQSEGLSANKTSAHDAADNAVDGAEATSSESTSDSGDRHSNHGSGVPPATSPTDGGSSNGMYATSGSAVGSSGSSNGISGGGGGSSGGHGVAGGGSRSSGSQADSSQLSPALDHNEDFGTEIYLLADDAHSDDIGYVEPDPADADAMLILLGGTATGWGDGATTTGDVQLDMIDYGPMTVAEGYAIFTSQGGEMAIADTFVVVEGADQVFMFEFDFDSCDSAQSITYVVAIDYEEGFFAAFDGEEDDVAIDGNLSLLSFVSGGNEPLSLATQTNAIEDVGSTATLEGQTEQGQLSLGAEVLGVDTLASIDGSMTEVDDQFSSVNGVVIGAA